MSLALRHQLRRVMLEAFFAAMRRLPYDTKVFGRDMRPHLKVLRLLGVPSTPERTVLRCCGSHTLLLCLHSVLCKDRFLDRRLAFF